MEYLDETLKYRGLMATYHDLNNTESDGDLKKTVLLERQLICFRGHNSKLYCHPSEKVCTLKGSTLKEKNLLLWEANSFLS